jgi:hypothetical protein
MHVCVYQTRMGVWKRKRGHRREGEEEQEQTQTDENGTVQPQQKWEQKALLLDEHLGTGKRVSANRKNERIQIIHSKTYKRQRYQNMLRWKDLE